MSAMLRAMCHKMALDTQWPLSVTYGCSVRIWANIMSTVQTTSVWTYAEHSNLPRKGIKE